MDNPEKAWQELNEQRRREYNHPEGAPALSAMAAATL